MILSNAIQNMVKPTWTRPELAANFSYTTSSGQAVSPESAKRIATVYRCANIISDHIAMMPLQQYISRKSGDIQRVRPDALRRNMAYLVEVQPNSNQISFILKKAGILWLLFWGDMYIWTPPGRRLREMFVLPSNAVAPFVGDDGLVWYHVQIDGFSDDIPGVEVLHVMINSTNGINGKSILTYARETIGRRQGANETQDRMYTQGLMPGAMVHVPGTIDKAAREKIRLSYSEAVSGAANSGKLLVLDDKIDKFEVIPISAADAQFLESIAATEVDIANFFGMPLYKLNFGKQSYESNDQQKQDYLDSTLDPYLVQIEQAAQVAWLTQEEQAYSYWRFNRKAMLRMDAKTRSVYLKDNILSAQMTPNEARAVEDEPAYPGGDLHFIPSNMAVVNPDGTIQMISKDIGGKSVP
jgi:HK97 family phage portal protein